MKRPSRRRRRRRRPTRRPPARSLWWAAALVVLVHFARHRWEVRAALIITALAVMTYAVVRARRWWRIRRRLKAAAISERRRDYLFEDTDFTRQNVKEGAYRRTMQLQLLATFGNACAKCGARDDGVDLDHFFWPKSEGGCFIMRHADGYLVNNAIPLCVHCNRSKSDRSYRGFFRPEQLAIVLEKNARMTRLLNERPPVDARGTVRARVRRVGA